MPSIVREVSAIFVAKTTCNVHVKSCTVLYCIVHVLKVNVYTSQFPQTSLFDCTGIQNTWHACLHEYIFITLPQYLKILANSKVNTIAPWYWVYTVPSLLQEELVQIFWTACRRGDWHRWVGSSAPWFCCQVFLFFPVCLKCKLLDDSLMIKQKLQWVGVFFHIHVHVHLPLHVYLKSTIHSFTSNLISTVKT